MRTTATKMGLLAVSLMLFVGAQAQHGVVIDSETDLLAQASDQLINVDHELEAIETIVNPSSQLQFRSSGQLPFGTRLPTYENTQFAYGYTIHDTSMLPVAQQSTNIAHINISNQKIKTSSNAKVKTASNISLPTRHIESNTDTTSSLSSHRINSNEALLPIAPIGQTSINMPIPDIPLDVRLTAPKNEFLQSASQIRIIPPAPPPDLVTETKTKPVLSVNSSYLPPVLDFKTESPQILTPPANDYLSPTKEPSTEPPQPSIDYLPPLEEKTEPEYDPPLPVNEYIPPKEDKTEPESDPPLPVNEYIPPKEDKTEPESDPPLPVNEYIPPKEDKTEPESDPPLPVNEYITPKEDKTEPDPDPAQPENEYIPPSDPPQPVNEYIPHEKGEPSTTSTPPSDQYLPPVENKSITPEPLVNDVPKLGLPESTPSPIIPIPRLTPNPPPAIPPNYATPIPPIGIKIDPNDHHIISGSKNDNQPPLLPIGERNKIPISSPSFPGPIEIIEESRIIPGIEESNYKPLPPITTHSKTPSPPIGIKVEHNDHHIISGSKNDNLTPLLPIGESYKIPISNYSVPEPIEIIEESRIIPEIKESNYKPLPPITTYFKTPSPPIGIKVEHNDHHIISGSKKDNQTPLLPIGESYKTPISNYSDPEPIEIIEESRIIPGIEESNYKPLPPITTYYKTPSPPIGIKVENNDHHIISGSKNANRPSLLPIGEFLQSASESRTIPGKEESNYKPLPPISQHNNRYEIPEKEKSSILSPIGIIGTHEDAVIIPMKIENPPPSSFAIAEYGNSYKPHLPTLLLHINNNPAINPITAKPPAPPPFLIGAEYEDNHIRPQKGVGPILLPAIPHKNYGCSVNSECSDSQICMEGMCVNACVIALGLCVGNAVCQTKRHVPGCVCPNMFTAITIRNGGQPKYDCRPMMMMMSNEVSANINSLNGITAGGSTHLHQFSRPISDFRNSHASSGRISNRNTGLGSSSDPCRPSPCGPNTSCTVTRNGIAQCRCLDDFVPDGNTINGCKPQCTSDNDCPDDYRCQSTKCVRSCQPGACGINADCDARNHRAICRCPNGYQGQAESRCTRTPPPVNEPRVPIRVDPCLPNPCGTNADCRERGERAVCTCPIGHEGDPLTNCRRGECIEANDCPSHLTCQKLRCIDPCGIPNICGRLAECQTRNHQPICSCGKNMVGDPFISCRQFRSEELCSPSPCGRNTNCKVRTDRAVCSCIDNYLGDPLRGCHPECVSDSECQPRMACSNNRCVNPCIGACGDGALCDVIQGRARCACPQYYQGNPQSRCYPECTAHDDCPSYQACYQLQCVDPCEGACGVGAECKVENHKPICFCPKGYTGHPFESCRPFTKEDLCRDNPCGHSADCTPGFDREGNDRPVCTCPRGFIGNPIVSCQRGECERHDDCRDHQACYAYTCQNPCYTDLGSVCGESADCTVKNHQPVCSCPQGYDGNPLQSCRPRTG